MSSTYQNRTRRWSAYPGGSWHMKGIQLVLVAALVGGLSGCGTFYPGDPPEQKPRFTAAPQAL